MGQFEILSLYEAQKWESYLHMLPPSQQDVYFTPQYYQLYEELGDGRAQCFVFKRGDDIALYPFLINSVNDCGFHLDKEYYDIQGVYGYNGIITSNIESDFLEKFNDTFSAYCMENNFIAEFTRFHPLINNKKYSEHSLKIIENRESIIVDLTMDYSDIWQNEYSSKNRNIIRKAENIGYKIQILTTPNYENIEEFISIYHQTMRQAQATPYYFFNKEYFFSMFRYLAGHCYLFNVLDSTDNIACTALFYHYGDYFHYHLSGRAGGADSSANNFLLDRAIHFGIEKGAKCLHLGGGRTSEKDDSLLRFKKNFSKKRVTLYIGKRIHISDVYRNITEQWETMNPEKIAQNQNLILKYRY